MSTNKLINEFYETLTVSKRYPPHIPSVKYTGLLNNYVPTVTCSATSISIKNIDCLEEALLLIGSGVCTSKGIGVLNMASDICPGGGVKRGATAQEEDICRRTTLYPTLYRHTYPLLPLELIYSPDIAVLKTADFRPIAQTENSQNTRINVMSMAAIRRPYLTKKNTYHEQDRALMRDKIRMVLQTAHYHGLDTLVLGAWGCGAFYNPPTDVALLFKELLVDGEFRGVFRHVSFAVLEPRGSTPVLGNAFRDVFRIFV